VPALSSGCSRSTAAIRWQANAGRRTGLGLAQLLVAVGDASAGPALGRLEQAAAKLGEIALPRRKRLGRDLDPHLMERRLRQRADLTPPLGDDRDGSDLVEQLMPERIELGRRRIPAGEDAEVDTQLDCRLRTRRRSEDELGLAGKLRNQRCCHRLRHWGHPLGVLERFNGYPDHRIRNHTSCDLSRVLGCRCGYRVSDAEAPQSIGRTRWMAKSNRQTTMAKIAREQAVRERRVRKQAKKDDRKQAAAEAALNPDPDSTPDQLAVDETPAE
jgi:hypothetical protein